eukprot:jgi/Astpho2/6599/fgenesh1_pm.00101_%23_4_t
MLFWVASFAALGGFLYGYDLALIGGALGHIRAEFHLSEVMVEMVVGAAKIGAVFGTFLGGAMMLYYGRRKTIGIDSLFYMTGPIIMAASWDVTGLVIGRFVLGIGIGISAVVVPTYLGEVAPARLRGRMVELYEVMLCAGMLGALLADVALMHVPGNWRWMVGMPFFPSAITAFGLFILPESPRWLVVNQRLDEALAVIHRIYTKTVLPEGCQNSTAEVEHELMDLWSSVEKTKASREEGFWSTQATMLQDIWLVMIGPERKAVWVAILLAFFNQGCASTAVINYAPTVLEGAGVRNYADATAWTAMITGAKTVGVFIAVGLVDSKGRRPLLIWGSAIIASSMALISLGDYSQNVPLVLFAMCAFILSFSASYAGIFWVLCSEMFSMSTKSPAVSAAAAMLFLAGAVSNLCFLSLHTALGAASFLIFGGIAAAGGIFVYFMVPETKGKTLAEGVYSSLGDGFTRQSGAMHGEGFPAPQAAINVKQRVP